MATMIAPKDKAQTPSCDMLKDCTEPVTHLDQSGYVYCTAHGLDRRRHQPCRKMRPHELNRIKQGKQILSY